MKRDIDKLMRALIATQVALLEFEEEDVLGKLAFPALELCVKQINDRLKILKRAVT